ncbi:MAG: PIN domain-containing protein [Acidimicrobiales bacterium]
MTPSQPPSPSEARRRHHQVFLAAVTVSELRYGALVAEWGEVRRQRLEASIQSTTIVPVTDALLDAVAELRYRCRLLGHPLHDRAHGNDLWIAASAMHTDVPLLTADQIFEGTPGLRLHM